LHQTQFNPSPALPKPVRQV